MSMPGRNEYKGFPRPTTDCSDDLKAGRMAVQASRDEVDINRIVARVMKGHAVPVRSGEPFYGDVSDLGGLQEAFLKVQEAEDLFNQYPFDVRARFENDPLKLVEFLEDPKNLDEAIKLGLAQAPAKGAPAELPAAPVPEQAPKV